MRRSSGWVSGSGLSTRSVLREPLGGAGAGWLAVLPVPGLDGTL